MTAGARRYRLPLLASALLLCGVIAWRVLILPAPLAFAGGHQVELAAYPGRNPTGVPPELDGADVVTRGKYLTEAADCMACHTAKGGHPFAGGRPFKLPFGTLYTPNITPDRETGIGAWNDMHFLRAVHEGISRDGTRLYPAFPYASYSLMPDADVLAIRRYLETIPAVRLANRPNSFGFPYNQRWLMAVWSGFFNPGKPFRPIAERSAQWNRGAYLVEGPTHCGECHTPRNLAQAMDTRNKFAGGVAEGWNAYNITSDRDSGIGDWKPSEIAAYLKSGHAHGRGVASGPMAEAVELSFSKLTPSDVAAIANYLRTIPARRTNDTPKAAGPAPGQPSLGAGYSGNGARIFADACSGCHAWNGAGAMVGEAQLSGNRAVNDATAANVALMILQGAGTPGTPRRFMPSFRQSYSDKEIADVANYVTARFGSKPSTVSAKHVGELRHE
ncbi:c-type cytochrome [Allosphingosinicella deserti]|uniref:c-type cytochrome n=1 Tax=Allosphingosinicella deserti TaxID=2116704 RepID=UPI001E61CDDA|nr:cytochrome c [Sphingomonas deserti]